jgi:uncharacterized membrane protein
VADMTEDTRAFERWSQPRTDVDDGFPGTAAGLPSPDLATAGTPDAARTAVRPTRPPVGVMDVDAQSASRARAEAIPSTVAIAGHPLHPMLVPLPIGLLVAALASDIAYAATRDRFWARASLSLTAGGVASGLLSAVAGFTDFATRSRIREQPIAWLHGGGNALVMGLSAASIAIRAREPERAVLPAGLVLSAASGGLLLATGWLGGELVFRHRIGQVVANGRPALGGAAI